jgi:hypothetical protein
MRNYLRRFILKIRLRSSESESLRLFPIASASFAHTVLLQRFNIRIVTE